MRKITLIGMWILALIVVSGCSEKEHPFKYAEFDGIRFPSCIPEYHGIDLCEITEKDVYIEWTPKDAVWRNGSPYDGKQPYCNATLYC